MNNCELHVNEAGEYLGAGTKNSKIYAEKAGDDAGYHINNCELYINKAGNNLGVNANNNIIYANETGHNTGMNMKNSKLYIKKLNGNIADSCFRGNNEIYLSKESYESFIKYCPQYKEKVKIWKEWEYYQFEIFILKAPKTFNAMSSWDLKAKNVIF